MWGGMTERERRALLKRRPNIASWAQLFAQARAAQSEQGEQRRRSAPDPAQA